MILRRMLPSVILRLFSLASLCSADSLSVSLPPDLCVDELGIPLEPSSDRNDMMHLAVCLQTNGNSVALDVYQHIFNTFPRFSYPNVNVGAWHSNAGNPQKAIEHLERYLHDVGGMYGDRKPVDELARVTGSPCRSEHPGKRDCVAALNNMASVYISEGKNTSAPLTYLARAIEIGDDNMLLDVYSNLGLYLARTGDEDGAANAYIKGFWISFRQGNLNTATGLLARRSLLTSTVPASFEETELTRVKFNRRVRDVTILANEGGSSWTYDVGDLFRMEESLSTIDDIRKIPKLSGTLHSWTTGIQTPHFYVHYKGFYDLPIQESVSTMFTALCPPSLFEVAPHLLTPNDGTVTVASKSKKRIGFVSCLIGGNEPHGQLVLDVIRTLSLTGYFEFFIISIGNKIPSSEFYHATDGNVFTTGHNDFKARELLKSLNLDCLIYLESMNDAMIYFLGFQRHANIQVLVMGSPVTSGIPTFDYFLSGDLLEHPFRTQLDRDHYSEQVVLFDGQAISFPATQTHPLQDSALAAGDALSLSNQTSLETMKMLRGRNEHVYLCFQSIFKIQPSFDYVLVDILQADYKAHIVLQASRNARQTSTFIGRLTEAIKMRFCDGESFECPAMTEAFSRVHFIARVTSDQVTDLMQQSSVILHPFPFGGSKTAFDAITAGAPIVTYPQQYLRGRMAAVFIRFMDLSEVEPDVATCCIASSISDYVSKAIRLASDETYSSRVRHAIRERRARIWDDGFVAVEWAKFLTRVLGIKVTEDVLSSRMGVERKEYQFEQALAKKVEHEQTRWKRSAMLSDSFSQH